MKEQIKQTSRLSFLTGESKPPSHLSRVFKNKMSTPVHFFTLQLISRCQVIARLPLEPDMDRAAQTFV